MCCEGVPRFSQRGWFDWLVLKQASLNTSETAVAFAFVDEPVVVSLFDIQRNRLGPVGRDADAGTPFSEHLTRVVLIAPQAFVDLHSLLEQLWFCGPDVQPA